MARLPFKRDVPAVCAQQFVYAGRPFKIGEAFPHAELKLSAFDLYGLWLAGRVDIAPEEPETADEPRHLSRAERKALRRAAG